MQEVFRKLGGVSLAFVLILIGMGEAYSFKKLYPFPSPSFNQGIYADTLLYHSTAMIPRDCDKSVLAIGDEALEMFWEVCQKAPEYAYDISAGNIDKVENAYLSMMSGKSIVKTISEFSDEIDQVHLITKNTLFPAVPEVENDYNIIQIVPEDKEELLSLIFSTNGVLLFSGFDFEEFSQNVMKMIVRDSLKKSKVLIDLDNVDSNKLGFLGGYYPRIKTKQDTLQAILQQGSFETGIHFFEDEEEHINWRLLEFIRQ